MKIVIELPVQTYEKIMNNIYDYGDMNIIIQNGEVLSEPHEVTSDEYEKYDMFIGDKGDEGDRAISLNDAIKCVESHEYTLKVATELRKLPSVTPKTGHWIDDNENELDAQYGRHLYKCSECNTYANDYVGGTEDWWDIKKPNYCPNCSAKMD